jgi:hypothetical protein
LQQDWSIYFILSIILQFRDRVTTPLKRKMLHNNEVTGPAEPAKKGKKKDYYGVKMFKFSPSIRNSNFRG